MSLLWSIFSCWASATLLAVVRPVHGFYLTLRHFSVIPFSTVLPFASLLFHSFDPTMPIRQFHWQWQVTISSRLNVASHLSDNARPNPRRLNAKGSFLHHVTHASFALQQFALQPCGPLASTNPSQSLAVRCLWRFWAAKLAKSYAERCAHLSILTAVRASVMYFEGIVAWGRCTLLTVMCSSICGHVKHLSSIVFSASFFNKFRPAWSIVNSYTSKTQLLTADSCALLVVMTVSRKCMQYPKGDAPSSWTSCMSSWSVHTASWPQRTYLLSWSRCRKRHNECSLLSFCPRCFLCPLSFVKFHMKSIFRQKLTSRCHVCYSGDVLPVRVTAYLSNMAHDGPSFRSCFLQTVSRTVIKCRTNFEKIYEHDVIPSRSFMTWGSSSKVSGSQLWSQDLLSSHSSDFFILCVSRSLTVSA